MVRSFDAKLVNARRIRHLSDISAARLCTVLHLKQRTPSFGLIKTITYIGGSGFEPGGRGFESLRARQILSIRQLVTTHADTVVDRINVSAGILPDF